MIAREALDAADIDRVVHHASAAARLARMLADIAADGRERIVLADEAHGVVIAARAHKRDITRDIDASRAERHARHRMVQAEQAAAMLPATWEI